MDDISIITELIIWEYKTNTIIIVDIHYLFDINLQSIKVLIFNIVSEKIISIISRIFLFHRQNSRIYARIPHSIST